MKSPVPPPWARVHCHIPFKPYGCGWYFDDFDAGAIAMRSVMASWHWLSDKDPDIRMHLLSALDRGMVVLW